LDADDLKAIFSKLGDQLKLKALMMKLSNCTVVVEKDRTLTITNDDIEIIDEEVADRLFPLQGNSVAADDSAKVDNNNESFSDEDDDDDYEDDKENKKKEDNIETLLLFVKLPKFSNNVEKSLQSGELWSNNKMRCQLINELSVFYSAEKDFILDNSKQYKKVGLKLLSTYQLFRKEIDQVCDEMNMNIRSNNTKNCTKKKLIQPWVSEFL